MHYLRNKTLLNEKGRTALEVLAVLAIMGLLSVGGIYGYTILQEKNEENELAHQIALNAIQIKTAIQSGDFKNKESFDNFLAGLSMPYKHYNLTYRVSDTYNQTYIMEITDKDGDYIKGKKCRQILRNLSKNPETTNLSFKVDNEETKTEETIWLAGKSVALEDICGG